MVEEIAMDRDAFVKDGGDEGRRMRGDIISNDEVGSTKMTMAVDALESDVEKAKGTERGGGDTSHILPIAVVMSPSPAAFIGWALR